MTTPVDPSVLSQTGTHAVEFPGSHVSVNLVHVNLVHAQATFCLHWGCGGMLQCVGINGCGVWDVRIIGCGVWSVGDVRIIGCGVWSVG